MKCDRTYSNCTLLDTSNFLKIFGDFLCSKVIICLNKTSPSLKPTLSFVLALRRFLRLGFSTFLRYLTCYFRYYFSSSRRFVKYSHVFAYFIRVLKSYLVIKNTSARLELHIQVRFLLALFMTSSSPKWSLAVLRQIFNQESPFFLVNLKSPFMIKYTPSGSSPCLYTNYPFLNLRSSRWYAIRRRCN